MNRGRPRLHEARVRDMRHRGVPSRLEPSGDVVLLDNLLNGRAADYAPRMPIFVKVQQGVQGGWHD
jgi:hypothetical protein